MRQGNLPWRVQFALFAGALTVVGVPVLLWPGDGRGIERLTTAAILGAVMLGVMAAMRSRVQNSIRRGSPISRWVDRTPAVRSARTIIGGVSLGWQLLVPVVWFGFMVAATPRALRNWIDGDPSGAPIVVIVGAVLVVVLILVVLAAMGAPTNARTDRQRYAAHVAESQASLSASVAPPAAALPLSDRKLRREARSEQLLKLLGADAERIEEAKSARRAKLVDRHHRRQQAAAQAEQVAAKQAVASEQREQTNRALGR